MATPEEPVSEPDLSQIVENALNTRVDAFEWLDHENRLYSAVYRLNAMIDGRSWPLVLKTWSNEATYRTQMDAIDDACRAFEDDDSVNIPFLARDAQHRILIMERVPDPSIESLAHCEPSLKGLNLAAWTRRLEQACYNAGSWLRRWHSLDPGRAHLGELLGGYLHSRAPDLDRLARNDRDGLVGLVDRLGWGDACAVHGDFTPWNVLWSPERLSVLDFGIGEWPRMSPAWDYQTMKIGIASELLFATRSPARWFKRLAQAPLHAFERGYGPISCDPMILNACAAVRHFNLHAADIEGPKAVRKRAAWHLASIQQILREQKVSNHRVVGMA